MLTPLRDGSMAPGVAGLADAAPWRVWLTVAGSLVSLVGGVALLAGNGALARRREN